MDTPRFVRWSVIGSTILVALTEILSLAHLLVRGVVVGIWLIAAVVVLPTVARLDWRSGMNTVRSLTRFEQVQLAIILFILAVTLFLALIAAPSMFDVLGYHAPRVSHWIQNKSVAHYPTHIDRQLWEPPLPEYYVLHLRLLAGNDRLANLAQWFSFAGCIALSMRIAGQLGADRTRKFFSGVFTATLPMAIAQASGSQSDLVASFWIAASASLTLDAVRSSAIRFRDALMIGASFGLAALAKGTAYFFLAPFVLWLILAAIRRSRAKASIPIAVAFLAAIAMNAGIYSRNYALYGSPLGKLSGPPLTNAIVTPASITSNVVRNLAVNFNSRSPRLDSVGEHVIDRIHRTIGISMNDSRTSYHDWPFQMSTWPRNEIFNGNPFHLILFAVAGLAVMVSVRARSKERVGVALCIASGFLLFSTIIRWQPFVSRLELPLFVLAAGLVASALCAHTAKRIPHLLSLFLFFASLTVLLIDYNRPIVSRKPVWSIPREQRYFATAPLYESHVQAADLLKSRRCSNIGLISSWLDFEELIWVVMRTRMPDVQVRHVAVSPSEYPDPKFRDEVPPDICAIVTDFQFPGEELATQRPPSGWVRELDAPPLAVYFREQR